jgi:hypothetical protein
MTTTQHALFALATVATVATAPPLTLPCIGTWLLMSWLGRAVDEADVSSAWGCAGTMLMIVFVGLAALALLFVGGAALGGAYD